jgi:cobalt-zinc-cadmium efflux system outer membrane protein
MDRWSRGLGALCVLLWSAGAPASDGGVPALTLEQALLEARARNPRLRAAQAQVDQAAGRLQTARTYPFNPELHVEAARRTATGLSETDHEIRLGQEIEIGRQRGARSQQAGFELDAARAELAREEQLLAAHVRSAFVEALRAREQLKVEEASHSLAETLAGVAQKRFDAGAVAQIEVNMARAQLGRAARDVELARAGYALARSDLAAVVGLDPARPPEPLGELLPPRREPPPLDELLAAASRQRPDLAALQHALEAARVRRTLAARAAVPNLLVEAFQGREEGTDELTGAALGIRLPLFDRNQGAKVEAQAIERQATAQLELAELALRQELASSLARYQTSVAAAGSLQHEVLGRFEENLRLLQRSFEAGKTSLTEVLIFRREFVDITRSYIETITEAQLAAIAIDLALGALQEQRP